MYLLAKYLLMSVALIKIDKLSQILIHIPISFYLSIYLSRNIHIYIVYLPINTCFDQTNLCMHFSKYSMMIVMEVLKYVIHSYFNPCIYLTIFLSFYFYIYLTIYKSISIHMFFMEKAK